MKRDRRRRLFDRHGTLLPGSAEYEVIHRHRGVSLRYYAPGYMIDHEPRPRTPLVLVPPLTVDTRLYDRRNEHSLVAYLSARGFDLYLIDWGWPSRDDDHRHLADYFAALLPEMLNRVCFHSGRTTLSLHGWRLGGLFALCCAAISSPRQIAQLVLLDTAVDYHADGAPGVPQQEFWQRAGRWRERSGLRARHLPTGLFHTPGWAQELTRQILYGHARLLSDDELLYRRAYPGGVVVDIIDYLWTDNVLAAGRLPMAQAAVGLAAVRAPILHLCDRAQPVCSSVCGERLAEVVGSGEVISEWIVSEAGADGALTPRRSWARVADWLLAREDHS